MSTTTITSLAKIIPQSETQWRSTASRAHRLLGRSGDEASARTHELHISEIRNGNCLGSSREIRYCPRCLEKGSRYILIYMGGIDRCGSCEWPA